MWPGYHMFIRKQCWHLVSEWNFGSDECADISLVWNQFSILNCLETCDVQRFHLQEVCAKDRFCILSGMKKSMTFICSISKIFHVMLWKENFNMWVICGSHSDCFVGQMGQQVSEVWPTFNPAWYSYIATIHHYGHGESIGGLVRAKALL